MAYAPIAYILPQYEDYDGWWLKGYEQGTTTPLAMATDGSGATTLAQAELDDDGFILTAGDAKFIPYFNQAYDLYLFPTEEEAEADITANAIQIADDINPDRPRPAINTMAELLTADKTIIQELLGFHSAGDGGGGPFYWDAAEDKANHNGITIIDPDNTADLSVWDATEKTTWFTAGVGAGCWKRSFPSDINPKSAGATGDDVSDDTIEMQNCSDLGESFDLLDLTYRITSRLTFSQNNQKTTNGKLRYDGPITDRLLDVTGNDATFQNVIFDGGAGTVRVGLVHLSNDILNPKILNCTFQNITSTNFGTNQTNQQYGLLINYDNVNNFLVDGCLFKDLTKANTTVEGPTNGIGFIGGIAIHAEDGTDPTVVYTAPSQGKIVNCGFDNIVTILDGSLSQANRQLYDDGDGIRVYGVTTYFERADVQISNCYFNKCSKRAVKSSADGVTVSNIYVKGDSNVYPMTTLVKLNNNNSLSGLIYESTTAKLTDIGIQIFYQNRDNTDGIHINDITIPHSYIGFEWIAESTATDVSNIHVNNMTLLDVDTRGFSQAGAIPNSNEVHFDNIIIEGGTTTTRGIVPFSGGIKWGKVIAKNVDWKTTGASNSIQDMELIIDDNTFAGTTSSDLIEIAGTNIGKLRVDAAGISTSFIGVNHTRIALIQGDDTTYGEIEVIVPEGLTASAAQIDFSGDDMTIGRYIYTGPGYTAVGSVVASSRIEVGTSVRKGNSASTNPFILSDNASSDDIVIGQCVDFRPTSAASVRLVAGNKMVVMNLATRTSGSATQDDTAGNMTVVNSTVF